jgi:hypothetical protein
MTSKQSREAAHQANLLPLLERQIRMAYSAHSSPSQLTSRKNMGERPDVQMLRLVLMGMNKLLNLKCR